MKNQYEEGIILDSSIQKVFHFLLENHIFLYIEKEGRSESVYLSAESIKKFDFDSFLSPGVEVLKVAGTSSLIEEIEKKSQVKRIENVKLSCRDNGFEVIFHADKNRILVAEVEEKKVTQKAENIEKREITKGKKKLLIIDDSKTIRNLLARIFSQSEDLEVVAQASRPSEVEDLIKKHQPDVITLDLHMPEMNGVELYQKVITRYSIPTVIISSVSMEEGPLVMEALSLGAIDYIQKPSLAMLDEVAPKIREKVEMASLSNLKVLKKTLASSSLINNKKSELEKDSIVLIGSSTGGTKALEDLFLCLPEKIPPILVVQHIPAMFSAALASRLNDLCPFLIKEAEDGDEVKENTIFIAPGGRQMRVVNGASGYIIEITDDAPVNRFKPSVDYLFDSFTSIIHKRTIGIILTGMGRDGAKGLLHLKEKGAYTIAQDKASSVVFGMPREAIALGAAEITLPLDEIGNEIVSQLTQSKIKKAV